MPDATRPTPAWLAVIGTILCRVVTPAWILTGALFKLFEANPGLLPRNILLVGDRWLGMDLDLLLAILISIEIFVAAVIIFVGRLAKPLALAMLAVFCLVLIGEIARGNTSCGCLGANSPSPWAMLAIDGGLLLAIAILARHRSTPRSPGIPLIAATGIGVAGAAIAFRMIVFPAAAPVIPPVVLPPADDAGEETTPADDGETVPDDRGASLPSYWFNSDYDAWLDQPWQEIDLFQFLDPPPTDLDEGTRYVVFYGRTCEHCEAMFLDDLVPDPGLAELVTVIEVPVDVDRLRGDAPWAMPDAACAAFLELPLGVNWVITTPLAVRLEDGRVTCATEGDHRECLGLE